jgi:hypothetical protein
MTRIVTGGGEFGNTLAGALAEFDANNGTNITNVGTPRPGSRGSASLRLATIGTTLTKLLPSTETELY